MRLTTTIFTLLFCMIVTAPLAQENQEQGSAPNSSFDFPDSREGTIAAAFVAAFNTGNQETMSAFISEYGSQEWQEGEARELYSYQRMYQLLGLLAPHSIIKSDDADIVLLVRSEAIESYFSVGLSLNEAEPRMLADHFIRPAARPKD